MAYYRIVNCKEIRKALMIGYWPPSDEIHDPYEPGEVIFLFEYQNPSNMITEFGATIADLRVEQHKVFVLAFDVDKSKVEYDKSNSGWKVARAHHGSIELDKIRCIGYSDILCSNDSAYEVSDLHYFDDPIKIEDICG